MGQAEHHFLVIGAGISGLLLARALRKNGIKSTIFEAETSSEHSRPREWGMSVHWGMPLLKKILSETDYDKIRSLTVDPSFVPPVDQMIPMYNVETGELLKDLPIGDCYRISRRKFRAWLAEGVDVQYAKSFQSYKLSGDGTSVTACFEDGSSATGAILVGTDGARSTVRSALLGPEKSERSTVPYSAVNLHVRYSDPAFARSIREYNDIFIMGVHPAGCWVWVSVQDVPNPADASTWVFQVQATWKSQAGEDVTSLSALKHRAASTFAEPFRSVFLNIPDDTLVYENKMNYWVPRHWDGANGRLLLLGDAVHPMTFQRGQGLNHCIADVATLIEAINQIPNSEEAIAKYQDEMVPRAGDEVKLSLKNTTMLHDWDMLMQSPVMARGVAAGVKPT